MQQNVRKSSVILRVFALVLGCTFASVTAGAQEKSPIAATATQAGTTSTSVADAQKAATGTTAKVAAEGARVPTDGVASQASTRSADNKTPAPGNVLDDYKKSLAELQTIYERQVQKLDQQNTQIKDLYRDGLISRVEMEKHEKELLDARAKVTAVQDQIAEANKPLAVLADNSVSPAGTVAVWSTGNNRIDSLVRFYGNKYGVDPYLIFCLMHQESRFSNNATSYKGAQGLMQLMPGTAARYGVTNPYDVAQSIMGGTRYLKDLLKMFNGRVDLALAGYNAGEGAVIKYGYNIPPYSETRNYVRLITARYAMKPAS